MCKRVWTMPFQGPNLCISGRYTRWRGQQCQVPNDYVQLSMPWVIVRLNEVICAMHFEQCLAHRTTNGCYCVAIDLLQDFSEPLLHWCISFSSLTVRIVRLCLLFCFPSQEKKLRFNYSTYIYPMPFTFVLFLPLFETFYLYFYLVPFNSSLCLSL